MEIGGDDDEEVTITPKQAKEFSESLDQLIKGYAIFLDILDKEIAETKRGCQCEICQRVRRRENNRR